ncbi:MAG: class B sortase [Lachnospiraceae bacterium]|nr:class B sortase [Lachnospiraceae bacterium]
MDKKGGKRIVKIIAGILGLAVVFFLGGWFSSMLYGRPTEEVERQPETEAVLQPPKAALTEEELEELFRSMKELALLSEQQKAEAEAAENQVQEEEGEIDFDYLWTVNPDIIAWITIPGTNIDYPVLQHPTDDSYYLTHNLDGSYGYPGCIYIESLNAADFSDPNTLIYGHNLKAKTMFTELHKFENKDFFEEYNEVILYLPDRTLHYRIFAAHVYDDRHLLYSFDFTDADIYAGFLKSIYDIRDMSANIDRTFEVTAEDRIISMETCVSGEDNREKRYLVHAVLQGDK